MKAVVRWIQVGGGRICQTLEDACAGYNEMMIESLEEGLQPRTKILFAIQCPDGQTRQITIRDEDGEVVAYGNFEGLPSVLGYAKEVAASE